MGILVFYRPAPESLKGASPSLLENLQQIKASLCVGTILLFIYLVMTGFTYKEIDKSLYAIFGLNNVKDAAILWPFQVFTHLFIHINLYHLLSNVLGVGLASIYERRVGSKRYLVVLMVGAFSSIPSIFFYTEPIIVSGISGGVFALAAAYFTDHKNLTIKEWIYAILSFLFLAIIFSLDGERKMAGKEELIGQVDHIGHVLGALGGVIYCRLVPLKTKN
ncbi:MAG: rhomboid family intramembrane serine protease [Alphaproteobacteria bacterium]|nr:rhomboid family intramembrane serine protease [Alphaproteobacteria bacterium]